MDKFIERSQKVGIKFHKNDFYFFYCYNIRPTLTYSLTEDKVSITLKIFLYFIFGPNASRFIIDN